MTKQRTLYEPSFEHDSCGIGAVVSIDGIKTHTVVDNALTIVERLEHRAGKDASGETGDGVGILLQIPHEFFKREAASIGVELAEERDYGIGMFFFPQDERKRARTMRMFEKLCKSEKMEFLAWRSVPVSPDVLGKTARDCMPCIMQCFVKRPANCKKGLDFDRKLYVLRRQFEKVSSGALRGVPAERVAEKPQALERGGDFPLLETSFETFCRSEKLVRSFTPFYEAESLVVGSSGKEAAAMIKAVPPSVFADDEGFRKHVNMIAGKFDVSDEASIVIGSELARRCGARLGSEINLYALSGGSDVDLFSSERVFRVTGVFHTGYADINATFAFINISDGKKYFGSDANLVYGVKLFDEANDAREIARISKEFPGLKTESWKSYNRSFFGALQVEKNMLMVLVFLIFVVVAINIFNAMRRMVFERREEISVLSAFGGKKRSIQSIFVMQGFLTGVSGAIPGAILGLFLSINMDTVFLLLSKLSYYATLFGVMILNPENGDFVRENPMFMLYASIPPRIFVSEVVLITLFGICSSLLAAFLASRGVLKMTVVEVMRDE